MGYRPAVHFYWPFWNQFWAEFGLMLGADCPEKLPPIRVFDFIPGYLVPRCPAVSLFGGKLSHQIVQ